jgi:hypothetical protein
MKMAAETYEDAYIEMTEEEAIIVDRVLTELGKSVSGWCGNCWINIKDYIEE